MSKDKHFIGYNDPTNSHWAISRSELDKCYLVLEELGTKEYYVLLLSDYKDSINTYKEGDLYKLKDVAHILGNISSYKHNFKIRDGK